MPIMIHRIGSERVRGLEWEPEKANVVPECFDMRFERTGALCFLNMAFRCSHPVWAFPMERF